MKPRGNIYPEATEGRIKTSDTPNPDEAKIISADVDGSKVYEDFKQRARLTTGDKLTRLFVWHAIFFIVTLSALTFSNALYGTFLPIISIIIRVVASLFAALLVFYVVRQIQISIASRRYKKNRKKRS